MIPFEIRLKNIEVRKEWHPDSNKKDYGGKGRTEGGLPLLNHDLSQRSGSCPMWDVVLETPWGQALHKTRKTYS